LGETSTKLKLFGARGSVEIEAWVDTGATFMKISKSHVEKVGIETKYETEVELDDGRPFCTLHYCQQYEKVAAYKGLQGPNGFSTEHLLETLTLCNVCGARHPAPALECIRFDPGVNTPRPPDYDVGWPSWA
jgi:hypothetical protein